MSLYQKIKTRHQKSRLSRDDFHSKFIGTILGQIDNESKLPKNASKSIDDVSLIVVKSFRKRAEELLAIPNISAIAASEAKMELELIAFHFLPLTAGPSDNDLEIFAHTLVTSNPDKAAMVKTKPSAVGWFVGQVMKLSNGMADPKKAEQIILKIINEE